MDSKKILIELHEKLQHLDLLEQEFNQLGSCSYYFDNYNNSLFFEFRYMDLEVQVDKRHIQVKYANDQDPDNVLFIEWVRELEKEVERFTKSHSVKEIIEIDGLKYKLLTEDL